MPNSSAIPPVWVVVVLEVLDDLSTDDEVLVEVVLADGDFATPKAGANAEVWATNRHASNLKDNIILISMVIDLIAVMIDRYKR